MSPTKSVSFNKNAHMRLTIHINDYTTEEGEVNRLPSHQIQIFTFHINRNMNSRNERFQSSCGSLDFEIDLEASALNANNNSLTSLLSSWGSAQSISKSARNFLTSARGKQSIRNVPITQEETLAMLISQELDNFDY
jgi:hypothetical protein